jgi:nucleotide-binding universal stress UspA family protein
MQRVKTILMAHDLSRRSSMAIERAAQLARQSGAALNVVHVIADDLPPAIIERRTVEATELIKGELSAILRTWVGDAIVHVLAGKDYTDILDRADKSGADLIVLGAHRVDALRPLVIGTTAERIIGFGARPVLVVKNRPAGQYGRVVVAVDFSASARRAAAFAFDFVPEAEIRLLHAAPQTVGAAPAGDRYGQALGGRESRQTERIAADLKAFLPSFNADTIRVRMVIRHGPALAVIRDEVKSSSADVLVVGVQHRSGLTRTLIGEISEDLLAQPPCDIITVPA